MPRAARAFGAKGSEGKVKLMARTSMGCLWSRCRGLSAEMLAIVLRVRRRRPSDDRGRLRPLVHSPGSHAALYCLQYDERRECAVDLAAPCGRHHRIVVTAVHAAGLVVGDGPCALATADRCCGLATVGVAADGARLLLVADIGTGGLDRWRAAGSGSGISGIQLHRPGDWLDALFAAVRGAAP